jgi:hypothetical protein
MFREVLAPLRATAQYRCRNKARKSCEFRHPQTMPAGIVEIEIAEAVIRAAPGVDWRHLREVLRAVKAAR